MNCESRPSLPTWMYLLKTTGIFGNGYLGRKPFHAGRTEEAYHSICMSQHVSCIFWFCNRAAMAEDENVWIDLFGGIMHGLYAFDGLTQSQSSMRSNCSFRGQAHMWHEDISSGACHSAGVVEIEYVWSSQQI